jgi:serine protease Do
MLCRSSFYVWLSFILLFQVRGTCFAQEQSSGVTGTPTVASKPNASAEPPTPSATPGDVVAEPKDDEPKDDEPAALPVEVKAESHARALSKAFRESAEKALPSVVTLLGRSAREGENPVLGIVGGTDMQNFDSVGSGVIISADGLILTNHHVIADTTRVEVRLLDGRQFTADETKSDPKSDLAIVKITSDEPFTPAELGNAADLAVGDWVLAIGSPFTLEASVSAGIISGTNRWQQLSPLVSGQFLQTDAAINPGNSGGPLIDLDGRVVGINTAISSRNGGFQGIGFAIPINRASWIKDELLKFGKVRRGFAGVRTSNLPYEVAKSLGLPRSGGIMINAVTPGYPADKAGLKSGDIVVEFQQHAISSAEYFQVIIQQSPIGEPLELRVLRNGEKMVLTIELEERIQ